MENQAVYSEKKLSQLLDEEAVRAVENWIKLLALSEEKIETNLPCLEFEI